MPHHRSVADARLQGESTTISSPQRKTHGREKERTITMAFEQKDGWGTIFSNDRKQAGSNQPDWTGEGKFEGKMVKLAIWVKDGKRGEYFSLSMKDKEKDEAERARKKSTGFEAPAAAATDAPADTTPNLPTGKPDDDVPF
jgi:hypothetical protein